MIKLNNAITEIKKEKKLKDKIKKRFKEAKKIVDRNLIK